MNIRKKMVTPLTFQLPIERLKEVALKNITPRSSADEVFQLTMYPLKAAQFSNIPVNSSTLLTSQADELELRF